MHVALVGECLFVFPSISKAMDFDTVNRLLKWKAGSMRAMDDNTCKRRTNFGELMHEWCNVIVFESRVNMGIEQDDWL